MMPTCPTILQHAMIEFFDWAFYQALTVNVVLGICLQSNCRVEGGWSRQFGVDNVCKITQVLCAHAAAYATMCSSGDTSCQSVQRFMAKWLRNELLQESSEFAGHVCRSGAWHRSHSTQLPTQCICTAISNMYSFQSPH